MSLSLKSQRFRAEREGDWLRLDALLKELEAGHRRRLSDDDVIALPVLYRATLSSLSMARSISLDQSLIAYLESLCTRAYFFVYGSRTTMGERLAAFFRRDWPDAISALWRETLVSAGLGVLGTLTAYLLTMRDPAWYFAFVPRSVAGTRTPRAAAELAKTLFSSHESGLSFFASFLFTHNAQIALLAFALGFACCLPTAFLLLYNGLMLGAFLALFVSHGLGVAAGGWLLIHGVTELFAITLAGAAGFRIGWSLCFPGRHSRIDALAQAGRIAATVMAGVVIMLAVAGLLEGFGRQLITSTPLRYGVAAFTALVWGVYFYRRRNPS
ncbi:MAG: stage II sporulation protein M [Alphaproteobacteria bacterium]|nr:stage II sporulation protein M [Alphaproteobacteria bacterium]